MATGKPAPPRMGLRRARCAVSLRNLAWHPSVEIQRQLGLGVGWNHGAQQLLWRWHVSYLQVWRVRQAKSTEPGVHFQDAQRLTASEDQYMRRFHSHNNSFHVGHTCHRRHVAEQLT